MNPCFRYNGPIWDTKFAAWLWLDTTSAAWTSVCLGTLFASTKMTHRLRTVPLLALIGLCGAAACTPAGVPAEPSAPHATPASPSMVQDAPLAGDATSQAIPTQQHGAKATKLTFTHDDFDAAVERAKRDGKLVFVDAWAEWCHTCLSMDSVVLSDPSLLPFADRYEFVALDTEKPVNASFVSRFEMDTWPTFFVVHPADLALIGFWPGAGSVREMREFLEQSHDAALALDQGDPPPHLSAFLTARYAQSVGKDDDAAKAFATAYAAMPKDWPRKSELLVGYIRALTTTQRFDECAKIGKKHLDEVTGAAQPAQFAQRYFTCLGQLKTADRTAQVDRALKKLHTLSYSPTPEMSFDDQVDTLSLLATAYVMMGDKAKALETQQYRSRIAEDAASKATTTLEARAFDKVRVAAYVDSGKPEQAIELLQQREREHPHGYVTPSLLADVLRGLGRQDDGLEALERAIGNSEGPRRCGYLEEKVLWLEQLGRAPEQLQALDRLIAEREKLRGATNRQKLEAAKARREKLR